MSEEVTGIIARVNDGEYGHGVVFEGREDWFNQGKGKDKKLIPWPPVKAGDKVTLGDLWTSEKGRTYFRSIQVHANPVSGKSGGQERDEHILWQVCLKVASDVSIANVAHFGEKASPITANTVLWLARLLFKGQRGDDDEDGPPPDGEEYEPAEDAP